MVYHSIAQMSTAATHHVMSKPRAARRSAVSTSSSILKHQSSSDATRYDPLLRLHTSLGNHHVATLLTGRTTTTADMVSPAPRLFVQRWDGPEHRELGDLITGPQSGRILLDCHATDLPQRTQPVSHWPKEWQERYKKGNDDQKLALVQGLTYGEIIGLSGDLYEDFDAMNRAPLSEIYDLIPLIRSGGTTAQLESASGGRYLTLAKKNESHFSNVRPGHRNIDLWRNGHVEAITAAKLGQANKAWGLNAAADHYLTDAFSGGHIRVERDKLHKQGKLGDLKSKIDHDLDDENGVEVTNARGDGPWIAYGDNFLADPRNRANRSLAEEAVKLSKQDIEDALTQGTYYPAPKGDTVFAAERLVPHPVDMAKNRWDKKDKLKTSLSVIKGEGPEFIKSIYKDDNRIRAWVSKTQPEAIGRQSIEDRVRLIKTMLNGPTLDDDENTILRILQASVAAGDQVAVITSAGPYGMMNDFNGAQEEKLRALYRASYYRRVDPDTAFKMIWSCIDGVTSEWEESMIMDILELHYNGRGLIEMVGKRAGGGARGDNRDYRNGINELEDQLDGYDEEKLHRLYPKE
jgi:hypothetical protein